MLLLQGIKPIVRPLSKQKTDVLQTVPSVIITYNYNYTVVKKKRANFGGL